MFTADENNSTCCLHLNRILHCRQKCWWIWWLL